MRILIVQNQHFGLAVSFPKFPEYGHAVDTGKVEVEYHEVEGLNVQQVERLLPVVTAVITLLFRSG